MKIRRSKDWKKGLWGQGTMIVHTLYSFAILRLSFILTKVPVLIYWSKGKARSMLCWQGGVSRAVLLPLLSSHYCPAFSTELGVMGTGKC